MKIGRILVVVAALTLAVAMVVGAASSGAWFHDEESSTGNTFTAGTLDIEIADSDDGWNNGVPVVATWKSPDCWVPGQQFDAIVRIKNTGCSDVLYLGADLKNYQKAGQGDGSDLAQAIEVVKFNKWIPGNGAWYDNLTDGGAGPGYASKVVLDPNGKLTLEALIDSYIPGYSEPAGSDPGGWFQDQKNNWVSHLTDFLHGNGYDGATVPGQATIPAGTTYQLELGFKFMDTAGNEYQGDTCQFDMYFYATQDISTLP